jgi:Ca2+-binding RTX toxin-like protein
MALKSSIFYSVELSVLVLLVIGGVVAPFAVTWSENNGDEDNDDDNNGKWSENEWDKDSLDDNIIYGNGLIFGTNHADFIIQSDDVTITTGDVIFAKDGDDEIQSGDLGDQAYGEDGDDTIQTSFGNDQAFGGNGNDNLIGGEDDDYLLGESGDDHLWGWIGDDALRGGSGADFFDCGEGIDEIKDFSVEQGDVRLANCEIVNTKD